MWRKFSFQRLQVAGLVINFEKCTFAVPEVDFLGYRVSASSFAPFPQQSRRHTEVPAAGDGEAAAGVLRSVQLLQTVRAGDGEDPAAPHRHDTGQPHGDGSGF